MRATLIGTGGGAGIQRDRCQAGLIVEVAGDHLQFDLGAGVTRRLNEAGFHLPDIGRLFITHYHADHFVDYAACVLSSWAMGRSSRLEAYGPVGHPRFGAVGLRAITERLFGAGGIHDADIVSRIEDLGRRGTQRHGLPTRRPDVSVHELDERSIAVETSAYRVTAAPVVHAPASLHCLAYRVDADGKSLVYSGDIGANDLSMTEFAADADVLIHECTRFDDAIDALGWRDMHTGPLALGAVAAAARVKKLVLTHFSRSVTEGDRAPDERPLERMVADVRRHFSGEVVVATDLMRVDL